jgi:hypothetical protein
MQRTLLLIILSGALPIHAASLWPLIAQDFTHRSYINQAGEEETGPVQSAYYIHRNMRAPYTPSVTFEQLCNKSHESELPWCFIVGTVITTERNGRKMAHLKYFDALTLYAHTYLYGSASNLSKGCLQEFAKKITPFNSKIHLRAFNHYPDGRTVVIDPGKHDRLALQLNYTLHCMQKTADGDTIKNLKALAKNYYKRSEWFTLARLCGRSSPEELFAAQEDAMFWLDCYLEHEPEDTQMQEAQAKLKRLTDSV